MRLAEIAPAAPALGALVGEIAVVVVGLVAIGVLFGPRMIAAWLAGMFRLIPGVGGYIADGIENYAVKALDWAIGRIWSGMGGAVGFLWRPVAWFISLMGATVDGLVGVAEFAYRVVTQYIPHGIDVARNFAASVAADVDARATAYSDRIRDWAAAGIADAYSRAAGFAGEVRDFAAAGIARVDAFATAVRDFAVAGFQNVDAAFSRFATWAQGDIDAAARQAEAFATTAVADAEYRIRTTIGDDVRAIDGSIEAAYNAALDFASQRALEAAAVGTAAAAVVATDLETYLRECGRNLCSGLNDLSKALQVLEAVVAGDLLVGFIAEAAHNPHGLAIEIIDVGRPLVDGAASGVRELVGVAH